MKPLVRTHRFPLALLVAAALVVPGALAVQSAAPDIRLETIVLGQDSWHAGSRASVRVITQDHYSTSPLGGSTVRIEWAAEKQDDWDTLYSGKTDGQGTVDAEFNVPEDARGQYRLKVIAQALGETDEVESTVRITRETRVMLTTDKPIYQPGQKMHIRALALKIPSLEPQANMPCLLEIMDSKGNKLFKKELTLSRFGVAGTEFQLASEINKGSWTVRATVGGQEVDKTITVERYVLPKFKVRVETERSFYLPGETVKGTVHSDYFFGKPVDDGRVIVKLSKFDVGFNDFAEINGRTDGSGVFEFQQKLPDSFVGQPLEQGDAFFKVDVEVTDGADHTEKSTITVPVAKDPLKVLVIPEAGQLIPNVENRVYVAISHPDGTPAENAEFTFSPGINPGDSIKIKPVRYETNSLGIGEVTVTPDGDSLPVLVTASVPRDNHSTSLHLTLGVQQTEESVLLRTDKAIAKVGDDLQLTALASKPFGYLYVDVVKEGQTILTTTLPFRRGKGEMVLPLTPEMSGSLELHAYRIARTGNIIRDTRRIYVNAADDLRIQVKADKGEYLPGKPAKLDFTVTDRRGRGLAAALGVSIVDESVYALQELQPGLERIYFMLEKELAEPKYEIHGITPDDIVKPIRLDTPELAPEKQKAARVLFAAVEKERIEASTPVFTLQANSYAQKIEQIREKLSEPMKADLVAITRAVADYYAQPDPKPVLEEAGGLHYLVREGKLDREALVDQWGQEYKIEGYPYGGYRQGIMITSAGPDRRMPSVDDLSAAQMAWMGEDGIVVTNWEAFPQSRARGFAVGGFGGMMDGRQWFDRGAGLEGFMIDETMALDAVAAPAAMLKMGFEETESGSAPRPEVRVRSYFPETLYFNPALITDDNGKASLSLDMADSITSWRLTAMGSSLNGQLGSMTQGIKVFQDFFVDIDLPVALTQNDEISIPVAVYNYLSTPQTVELVLTKEPWFELDGLEKKTLEIEANSVRGVSFRVKVKEIGWHTLTLHGYGSKMNDAIRREIEVQPDGKRFEAAINDRLERDVTQVVNIPAEAIDNASNILVKVYPGYLSQVVEGMDSMLQMPFGCFEQTSSVTYPNILVLDYMRSTRQSTPEIQMKAEQYINVGYQRLVSYEVPGGGFEWFGNAPANQVLTAYGLLEFSDMSKVYEVDPALIERTQKWLLSKQNKDGSWTPDRGGIAEGAINRQTDEFRTSAYVLWALAESKAEESALASGLDYIRGAMAKVDDPYALALAANALLSTKGGEEAGREICRRLIEMRETSGAGAWWTTTGNTAVSSTGKTADIETTALVALALIKSGGHADVVNQALTYLIQARQAGGTWGGTQSTIWALKALITSMQNQAQDINADITVLINGQEAGRFRITPKDSDVLRQVDCRKWVQEGDNKVEIRFSGKGTSLYAVESYHYMPWKLVPGEGEMMDIGVSYDRTELETDDLVTSTVKVNYSGPGTANMVIVDLGIPPGFDVMAEDLEAYVKDKTFQKYTLTGRQAIIYIEAIENGKPIEFKYRMKAKFPIRAQTPKSETYLYYNPDARATAPPVEMVVN